MANSMNWVAKGRLALVIITGLSALAAIISGIIGATKLTDSESAWIIPFAVSSAITIVSLLLQLVVTLSLEIRPQTEELKKHVDSLYSANELYRSLMILSKPVFTPRKSVDESSLTSIFALCPAKLVQENLNIWAKKCGNEEGDNTELWKKLYRIYLSEELKDISIGRIASNVEIYTKVLLSCIHHFICLYKKHAEIYMITSLLPSDWYDNWNKEKSEPEHFEDSGSTLSTERWPPGAFAHVEDYRKSLVGLIKTCKTHKVHPAKFKRYVLYTSDSKDKSSEGFYTTSNLISCINNSYCHQDKKTTRFDEYVLDLHFKSEDALSFNIDHFGRKWSSSYRDILIFGDSSEPDKDKKYKFAINSTMDPSFPVMFVEFMESDRIEFAGQHAPAFIASLENRGQPLVHFRKTKNSREKRQAIYQVRPPEGVFNGSTHNPLQKGKPGEERDKDRDHLGRRSKRGRS